MENNLYNELSHLFDKKEFNSLIFLIKNNLNKVILNKFQIHKTKKKDKHKIINQKQLSAFNFQQIQDLKLYKNLSNKFFKITKLEKDIDHNIELLSKLSIDIQNSLKEELLSFSNICFSRIEDINFIKSKETLRFFKEIIHSFLSNIFFDIKPVLKKSANLDITKYIEDIANYIFSLLISIFFKKSKIIFKIISQNFNKVINLKNIYLKSLSKAEIAHQISKEIINILIEVLNIYLTENIKSFLKTLPFNNFIIRFILESLMDILSSIASVLVFYSLDKIDLFKYILNQKYSFIKDSLNSIKENNKIRQDDLNSKILDLDQNIKKLLIEIK
ncbi:MAG: hypothetical protein R3Y52_04310 [Psittacicella sp.]